MQDQDTDLIFGGVVPFAGLDAGALERDSDVTEGAVVFGRKRQDVGRVVLLEKSGVQGLQFRVVGDAAMELTSARNAIAQQLRERFQVGNVEHGRLAPVSYQRVGFHLV